MPWFPAHARKGAGGCRAARRAPRWAAGLALAALALGCDGTAEPVFLLAGGNSAGGGGRGGRGGSGCIADWPAYSTWRETDERAEEDLFTSINTAIDTRGECAGEPFEREPFAESEDYRCWSRRRAQWEYNDKAWGRPAPALWPTNQFAWIPLSFAGPGGMGRSSGGGRANDVVKELLSDPGRCAYLKSTYNRALGVGHQGYVWALTFGPGSD